MGEDRTKSWANIMEKIQEAMEKTHEGMYETYWWSGKEPRDKKNPELQEKRTEAQSHKLDVF